MTETDDIQRLTQLASFHKTELLTRFQDIDVTSVFLDEDAESILLQTDNKILITNAGELVSASLDAFLHKDIKRLLAQKLELDETQIIHRPAIYSVVSEVLRQRRISAATPLDKERSEQKEESSDVQRLLTNLLEQAISIRASDIHIEANINDESTPNRVQFRVFGRLGPMTSASGTIVEWSNADLINLCSVTINSEAAKSKGVDKHFTFNEPLDASFEMELRQGKFKVRYAQTPTVTGFKAVYRMLQVGEVKGGDPQINDLGYTSAQALLIEHTVRLATSGLIILSGPTGSGKTTTLATLMRKIPQHLAVYTYEDPVEYVLPNITQVPVSDLHASNSWEALSKNSLRMDPDVIMYGELRSSQVAHEIVHASTTGHLVYTTLHTNSAIGCITRLHDLGISLSRLAEPGFLKLLVFQRLIPKLCPHCAVPVSQFTPADHIEQRQLQRIKAVFSDQLNNLRFAQSGQPCSHCESKGFSGRLLIAEAVVVDDMARQFIANGDLTGWELTLYEQHWRNIMRHAFLHISSGEACPLSTESALSSSFTDQGGKIAALDYADYE